MKKLVLIDGNNLVFRSYFATAYTGNVMRNSKNFPTNALYGFTLMINKIMSEENPEYVVVAFDIGKNFRKEKYDFYKEGREATPDELKMQMPIARDILDAMGICHLELAPYEADDIIGTVAKISESDDDFSSVIVSSDKDLLQLISNETEIKLLKQTGFIRYDEESFKKEWGIDPIRIIDLKALMGDPSDNIPGVKGIGEKTALKLLQEYKTLDGIYENIDSIKGKLQEKLIQGKDDAYMSYEIATIYRDVPLNLKLEDFKLKTPSIKKLKELFEELEFSSMLKKIPSIKMDEVSTDKYIVVNNISEIELDDTISYYLEVDNDNYHLGNAIGLSITTSKNTYYIKKELINDTFNLIRKCNHIVTYDLKKSLVVMKDNISCEFDLMLASYLLDNPSAPDISLIMEYNDKYVQSYDEIKKNNFEELEKNIVLKSKFIYDFYKEYKDRLVESKEIDIFNKIEMPLTYVLADMEKNGFRFENNELTEMKKEVTSRIKALENEIHDISGSDFNIASPKQLSKVLFEDMGIGSNDKRTKQNTNLKNLKKYEKDYPIISKILEYRNLSKLYNTYLDTLDTYVRSDGKIHTIFNQTLTRTGRLSSMYPNLQNIPIKEDYGKMIRKAFVPSYDLILSADYSQIELRVLAHISNCKELIDAFKHNEDIHTKVAADIYGIKESEVSKHMRSTAKAVIFGIVYGISGFGLGENLNISPKEAKAFIDKYYEFYPGVKEYMNNVKNEAYKTGEVKTMFGRVRKIKELSDLNFQVRAMGERIAFNTPIQGSSADIMKMAMIEVYNKMKENNLESKMILQIHDEIVIDVKKNELDKLTKIVKETMENIVNLSVPLKVEISTGTSWYDAK